MGAIGSQQLVETWELGANRHPLDRGLLLLALAEPELAFEQLADLPLSRRNAAIIALRQAQFGNSLAVWYDCPACGERMELAIDADVLPPPPDPQPAWVSVQGIRFHTPGSRQLAKLFENPGAEPGARQLLAACAESEATLPLDPIKAQALLEAVDAALEQADPWLDIAIAITCPVCAEASEPSLDIAALVWEELDAVARRLLDEVHLLASAYGWRECDILAMSAQRRNAYLERVQT
jgi:hypothetical protein